MREIERIYIHCSDSLWGNLEEIRRWHTDPPPEGRGWSDIGYHWLVTNFFPYYASYKDSKPIGEFDGMVWAGRLESIIGAGVHGDNHHTIHICLVGVDAFSPKQVDAAAHLASRKCLEYGLTAEEVWGHCEYWTKRGEEPKKSCPNLAMPMFRRQVEQLLAQIPPITPLPEIS